MAGQGAGLLVRRSHGGPAFRGRCARCNLLPGVGNFPDAIPAPATLSRSDNMHYGKHKLRTPPSRSNINLTSTMPAATMAINANNGRADIRRQIVLMLER